MSNSPVESQRWAIKRAAARATLDPTQPGRRLSPPQKGVLMQLADMADDSGCCWPGVARLSERTAARLRSAGLVGRTVSIKVRFADFTTITRARTLRESTDVAREVYATARSLFDALGLQRARLRLVGVRVEGLAPADLQERQLLLDEPEVGWRDAERAVDRASADRCGFHPPQREGYPFPGPDLHWDLDLGEPLAFGTQGIVYLADTPAEQGALTVVPGFHTKLADWLAQLPPGADPQAQDLHALGSQPVAGRAGDMVIWHHWLPHGSRPNLGRRPRIVQYLNLMAGTPALA